MSVVLYALEDLVAGDAFVIATLSTAGFVRKAMPALLEQSGIASGIVREDCAAGDTPLVYMAFSTVPRAITGLPTSEGYARVGTNGRPEWVPSFSPDDYPLGLVSAAGDLLVDTRTKVQPFAGVASLAADPGLSVTGQNGALTVAHADAMHGRVIAPTATLAAALNALTAVGVRRFRLLAGNYTLESRPNGFSDLSIAGAGVGRTIVTWGGAAGSPTDIENAMVRLQGAKNPAVLSTTPTSTASGTNYYPAGSAAVSVASTGSAVSGTWFAYDGENDPTYSEYSSSSGPGVRWSDLVQIESISSLTLRLAHHTLSHHTLTKGAGAGPQIAITAVDVIERVTFEDLTLDGGANIAVGVLVDYGVDITFRRVEFKNFAHHGVAARWGRGITFDRCHLGSACTSLVWGQAQHKGSILYTTCAERGVRENPVGRTWGVYTLVDDCAGWTEEGCVWEHKAIGAFLFGFRDLTRRNNTYRDLDNVVYKARSAAANDDYTRLLTTGVGQATGFVSLNLASFNGGLQNVGNKYVDCCTDNVEDPTVEAHDCFAVSDVGTFIGSRQRSPYHVMDGLTRYTIGVRVADCDVTFTGLYVYNCEYAFKCYSTFGCILTGAKLNETPAEGTAPVIALYLEQSAEGLYVNGLELQSIYFAPAYTPGFGLHLFSNLVLNERAFSGPLRVVQNTTGGLRSWGDICSYDKTDTTAARKVIRTNHATDAKGVVRLVGNGPSGISNNGFCLGDSGKSFGLVSVGTGEIQHGDSLNLADAVGAGSETYQLVPGGAGPVVCQADQYKAAGSAGQVMAEA